MGPAVRVECHLQDCVHHTTAPGDKLCHCTHPDKRYHLFEDVCPLYILDWAKSDAKAAALRKRFGLQ